MLFASNAILRRADDHEVNWHYIAPSKPECLRRVIRRPPAGRTINETLLRPLPHVRSGPRWSCGGGVLQQRRAYQTRAVETRQPMALCRRITGQEAQMELWLMIGMIIISVYFCLRH